MRTTWRQFFRPIIARILEANKHRPWKETAKILRAAGPRPFHKHWPYKVWLSEIRRQRGLARGVKVHSTPLLDEIDP